MAETKKATKTNKAEDKKEKKTASKATASKKATKTDKKEATKKAPAKKASSKKDGVFAVIETGGKQYVARVGQYFDVEKVSDDMKEGDKIVFDKVLLIDDGAKTDIGSPYLSGKKVEAKLLEQGKGKKVNVIRFKSKSRYFRKKGHRQPYMKVEITKIG